MRLLLTASVLAILLAGCAASAKREQEQRETMTPVGAAIEKGSDEPLALNDEEPSENVFTDTELYSGSGDFIDEKAASRRPSPPAEDGEITLNFEGQGIQEVVHAILGHMLQENYVIAPGVSGEVTFSTARPISRDQIMPILEMLLRWNGATLIWRDDRYQVLPVDQAIKGRLAPRVGSADLVRGFEVLAVPLEFVSPAKMSEILEPYAFEGAIVNADNARSLLFLAGTRSELRNYMQIIDTFDVDWLKGMSIGIFNLERVEVADVVPELEAVFGNESETPLAGMFRFVPIERLNAVMVITPQEDYLHAAEDWIDRLDRSSAEAGSRLYVYRVKNLEADVLAGYLGDLFGSSGGAGSRSRSNRERGGSLGPGMEEARVSSVSEFQQQQSGQDQSGDRGASGPVALGESEDIRVTAVMETNSLLIQASPQEYDAILSAIKRLDEEPLQVLIEAQVIEVELNEALEYGVNWYLSNTPLGDGSDGRPGSGDDSDGPGFSTSRDEDFATFGRGGDFLATITRRSVDRTFVTATITALDRISNVRTLSSPSLLVRNNAEARINVGTQIPVSSQSFIGGGTNQTISSAQYLNTGVILEVVPRVNPGGLVYLQVSQEVSSPGAREEGQQNQPINNRQVTTEVAVQSGQTIVLGGLIRETQSQGRSGLPLLSRLPLVGPLFGGRTSSNNRSETLVLITPTVMESTTKLEEVSREFERKFKGLEPLRRD